MSLGRRLAFALLAVLLVLAGAELFSRFVEIWRPPLPVDYGLGFDPASRVFVEDADVPGSFVTNPAKTKFFRPQRLALEKPPETFRIAVVGGSSVNFLQRELQAMASRLAEGSTRFERVEIVNAGGISYGSHRLVGIASEVLRFAPDLLLLYSAHNEFEEVEQLHLATRGAPALQAWLARSALVRAIRDAVTALRIALLERDHNARILSEFPPQSRAWTHAFSREDVGRRMRSYRDNLIAIAELAEAARVPLVIGSVPSNLARPVLSREAQQRYKPVLLLLEQQRYEEGVALGRRVIREMLGRHQSSDLENAIIRALARGRGIPLADVERAVTQAEPSGVPGQTLMRDHCHLNARGRAIWIATFAPFVRDAMRAAASE